MADNSDLQKIQASEKPTSDDFEYAYVETVNKAFVRIAKERLKEILGANRYTNEEIDQKLSTIPKFNIEVVSSLPTTDISETTIYLVSSGDDSENLYTEYININGLWEILGTQKSTFSGSAKDVTYDDTETKLGATNVQDAVGKLSATINNLPSGKNVKTILENIMTIMKAQVDFEGRPQAYSPDISDIASQTDILIANLNSSDGEEPDTPENPTVTLSSISATYNGGNVAVGTALTDLTGITVKAHYSDGSTANVTDYTLSGTIAEGNNTITVSYGGKTTTITVVGYVEQVEPTEPVYKLAQATTFDGATSIDTGYKLLDVDKSWSVCVDFTGNGNTVWDASPNASKGMCLSNRGGYFRTLYAALTQVDISGGKETNHKVIVTHTKGTNSVQYHYIYEDVDRVDNEVVKDSYLTDGNIISSAPFTVKLGANYSGTSDYYKGTIHRFEIYERVLSGDEINAFMEGV